MRFAAGGRGACGILCLALALTLIGLASGFRAVAQPFAIVDAGLDASRRAEVSVESTSGAYLVLHRGTSPASIRTQVAATFATSGINRLTDPTPIPSNSARFYRVEQRAVTASGDLDADGIDDVYELGLAPTLDPLDPTDAGRDADNDGATNLDEYLRGTDPLSPNTGLATGYESSPDQLETGVSVQRETVFQFPRALAAGTVVSNQVVYAEAGGRRLLTRPELSGDRRKLTLFYLEPMPGGSRVRVFLNGDLLRDDRGQALDGDRDGRDGGLGIVEFDTFGNQPQPSTGVVGQVFASEVDDTAPGGSRNRPLAGVIITVDGAEQTLRAVTDAEGRFHLQPAPAGRFFVHIDGRQATGSSWPNGSYYPVVGKAWETQPGRTNNPAGESGVIYLPLIAAGSLQPVHPVNPTTVTFPPAITNAQPELAGVEVRVPPNALVADNGTRGGRLGIAPVAPDRIPSPLPAGLNLPLVITIQTDGAQNFDQPVPVRFPNLPDPKTGRKLAAGEKSALWSFNHDTGHWELVGPMTVTADGNFVETDPGVGVLQPGWHGTQPGVGAGGGPLGGPDDCNGGGGPGAGARNCRQNPDFDPEDPNNYNGCGPDGADYLVPDNPNGLAFPCASFFDACKAHDIGYNTCGRPKQQTDDRFLADMLAACECLSEPFRSSCRLNAVVYHRAVTGGGGGAFGDAQDKACKCDDPPPPPAGCDGGSGSAPVLASGPGFEDLARRLALHARRPSATGDAADALIPQLGPHRFAVIDAATGEVLQRGHAGSAGVAFSELILAPRTTYDIAILQEATLREGLLRVTTGPSGSRLTLPPILIEPARSWDFDADGLHDLGELVLGTDPRQADSDGDGVNDAAEARQGTNPLDGTLVTTGVVGSARTPGTAVDVAAVDELVVTANDGAGVSLFSIANPFTPVQLATVPTAGRARAVAVNRSWIAVADGPEGLAVLDASQPSSARKRHQIRFPYATRCVAVLGDLAYVGLEDGSLQRVDLRRGALLDSRSLGAGAIQDLALSGDVLLALTTSRLFLMPLDNGEVLESHSLAVSAEIGAGGRRPRLFAAEDLAFFNSLSGFSTVDISDPAQPRLLRQNETGQRGWKQIVPSGSGLALAAVDANSTDDGAHDVSLFQVGVDGTTNRFLASFPTPGLASALVLHRGLAYVADGTAGLQVVNYLAADRAGQAPTLELHASFSLDPARAEEGKLVRLTARVRDDVQVREVAFTLDGREIASDGSHGFEARFLTPLRSASRSTFTVRARATDTGGNQAWSDEIVVELVPDATPPRVVRRSPEDGAIEGSAVSWGATFNEPVQPGSLNLQTLRLRGAGADGLFGTADDLSFPGASVVWRAESQTVEVLLASPLEGGIYEARLRPPIADLAGNALAEDVIWRFWILGGTDTDRDGIPDAVETALGTRPDLADTDLNGVPDGAEDFDRDGLRTAWELVNGLDPRRLDTDEDGVSDALGDLDLDGLNNRAEHDLGLNARGSDTDGDGWDDNGEVASGSDPRVAASTPTLWVASVSATFLNAVPDTLPAGTPMAVASSTASFLNATPETVPAGTPIGVISSPAAYLNAIPEAPPAGTSWEAVSAPVSFLNALPEPALGPVTLVSPIVSYHHRQP